MRVRDTAPQAARARRGAAPPPGAGSTARDAGGAGRRGEHVGVATRCAYGFGSVAEGVKNVAFNTFLLFYYNAVLGLSGTLAGAAIFVALCVDAITDPLVGSLSDNLHSRWGRRHPFLYASALPMGVAFWLLFNPPAGLGATALFLWFVSFAVLVRSAMTLYSIPSNAMVAELTPSYDERTSLVAWRFFFGWAGGIAMAQVAYRVFFTARPGLEDGRLDAAAYGGFALVGALTIVVAILVCALGTHHVIPRLKPPPAASRFTVRRLVGEVREVLGNRSYLMLVIASLFASVAGGFNDVVGLYLGTYFWGLSSADLATIALFLVVSLLAGVALARPLAQRFEKRRSAVVLTTGAICLGPLPVFLRLLGLMPPNGHPALLPLLIAHATVMVTAVIVIGILLSSMVADVIDENELVTGKRQEGMFSSAIAFTAKATSGVGGFLAGLALDVIAFPTRAAPGTVPAGKLFVLGLAVGPCMLVLYLLTLVFLRRYDITRARHAEILARLDARASRGGA
jgi:GPH family glycoside/pentoside/hexuronide:cation symporter